MVTLDSLRIAAASGRGSVGFFGEVGDDGVAVDAGDDEGGGAVAATVDDASAGTVGELDEQPATRAAATLTTVRTPGSLRMPPS